MCVSVCVFHEVDISRTLTHHTPTHSTHSRALTHSHPHAQERRSNRKKNKGKKSDDSDSSDSSDTSDSD